MVGYILKNRLVLIFLLGVAWYVPSAYGQVTESQAREMLSQRGIPEDSLRARLIKKGIDPDNIPPEQLVNFQSVIVETIEEFEAAHKVQPVLPAAQLDEPKQAPGNTENPMKEKPEPVSPAPERKEAATYGQEIFRNNSIAVYQKTEDQMASDAYVLGVGDKLGVIGFGRSQFEQILEIGPSGFVQPSNLPKILLKDLRFGDAKELLFQRYSQYYIISRGEFQVTLNKPREMTVNVFGEAKTTGSFRLSGVNTAFNVLSAAGGPTDIGSVRRIKVIRGGTAIPLDVYEFMNDPGVERNYFLQNNDVIHIPVAQKVVTIRGAVTRPMAYELLDKENLIQLLKYAGGTKANAYLSDVQITRFLENRTVITNVNLKELSSNGGDYVLYNGDIIEIKTIELGAQNFVSISGAVVFPGNYEKRDGYKISDLVQQSILKPDARMDFASLLLHQADGTYRYERVNLQEILDQPGSPANRILQNQDIVQIMTLQTFAARGSFSVTGSVKQPNTFPITPDGKVKLEDALILAGGMLPEASDYGYIIRMDPAEPKKVGYVQVNLKQALEDPASASNIEIKSGDQVRVFNKSARRDELTVSIYGAVRNPGMYLYGQGMTLGDVISMAEGFRFEADIDRVDIARTAFGGDDKTLITQYSAKISRDFETDKSKDALLPLQPFDHIYVRTIPDFQMQETVQIDGEVKYPGTYPLLTKEETVYDLVQQAGGLSIGAFPEGAKLFRQGDSTGLVVIDLATILRNKNTISNIRILQGDILTIPKSRELVTIEGYVNLDQEYSTGFLKGQKSISVAFRGEKSAKYYVDTFAAGVSKDGAKSELKVQYADGRVEKTSKFLFFNNYPAAKKGSTISVGPKRVKPPVQKSEKNSDWSNVLRDTLAQATAVLTLLILVDQLAK